MNEDVPVEQAEHGVEEDEGGQVRPDQLDGAAMPNQDHLEETLA